MPGLSDRDPSHATPSRPATPAAPAPPAPPTARQHAKGLTLIVMVSLLWVGSAELIQFIFGHADYQKPYFLTYLSAALFSIYLLGFLRPSWRALLHETPDCELLDSTGAPPSTRTAANAAVEPFSARRTFSVAAALTPLFFLASWSFNLGLVWTSVASSSTISTLSSLFTLLVGRLTGVERFSPAKLFAALLTIGGVAVISAQDTKAGESEASLVGDAVSVLAALLYALYTTMLKRRAGPEGALDAAMMFGFLGLAVLLAGWPGLVLLHVTGWETFELPAWRVVGLLLANALMGTVLSEFLWAKSIVLTTPLIGTLALSLTVPLSVIVDYFFRNVSFSLKYLVGVTAVFVGFFIVNLDEALARKRTEHPETQELTDAQELTEFSIDG